MKPTITEEQAVERVDRYIEEAMRAIGTGRLEENDRDTYECAHPDDGGPQGRVSASAGYFIRDLPVERNDAAFQAVRGWLKRSNFEILDDFNEPYRFLNGQSRDDSFRVGLRESSEGSRTVSVMVTSPCVWPNGTPEPTE